MREGRHESVGRIQNELLNRIDELLSPAGGASATERILACRLLGTLASLKGTTTTSQVDLARCVQLLHQELAARREVEVAEEAAAVLGRLVASGIGLAVAPEMIEAELTRCLVSLQGEPSLAAIDLF